MAHSLGFPTRGLVSQQDAAVIENASVPRSTFHNQWTLKTTFGAGNIIPILVQEILPGDHMAYEMTCYIRMQTPINPMFDNQRVDTFFFFVPNRLLWENWVRMMGEQASPSDPIAYTIPQCEMAPGGPSLSSIFDYMGIPITGQILPGNVLRVNALPLRAYNLIYQQWFRDENLQGAVAVPLGDGPDSYTSYNILRRAKSADYFTSALPWPQKFTAPTLPIGGLAPVIGIGAVNQTYAGPGSQAVFETAGATNYSFFKGPIDGAAAVQQFYVKGNASSGNPQIYADLSSATGTTINQLRQAWMVQSLLERDARGGTRYVELIRSHFGVINPDFRLQRPEYIGGGQTALNITPIAQTAPTAGVPLGALGGAGTAAGTHRASYAATEHGYIIGLINVKSEISYSQGLHRMWTRKTRYDFYWPALAQLGEQAIRRDEIYTVGQLPDDETVFGYQERWMEYRTEYSKITAVMRPQAAGTLASWHLGQLFGSGPSLNSAFIVDNPPMDRVLAGGSQAASTAYFADIMFRRKATRPIPTYGTPAILGRF